MRGTVGVAIPVYNGRDTVVRALLSVLDQTLAPQEVVVVDDGSTDDTPAVVAEFTATRRLDHWRLVRQENAGPAAARDAAIRSLRSAYVAFLDADDQWAPDHLRLSLAALQNHRFDVVGSCLSRRRATIDGVGSAPAEPVGPRSMLFRNPYFTSTVVLRRDAYLEAGGFDLGQRYSEDYKLWLSLAFRGYRLGRLPHTDVRYGSGTGRARGLSSRLWQMERNELGNYLALYRNSHLSRTGVLLACGFSLLKFGLRVVRQRGA